jgi:hypothetical protein
MTDELKTRVVIGGVPVLASAPAGWTLTEGAYPTTEEFAISAQHVAAIRGMLGQPVEIEWEVNNVQVRVRDVYPVNILQGESPAVFRVRVQDRRWLWPYAHILRRFNMRRTVGFRRIKRQDELQLQDVVDRVWFKPWSLFSEGQGDESRWKPSDIILHVLGELAEAERQYSGRAFPIRVAIPKVNQLDVEEFEIDDDGASAVQRIMQLIPEAGITVDPDGTVRVFSRVDGGEFDLVGGPRYVDTPLPFFADNSVRRPREIHVLFTIEAEVKFDYREIDLGGTGSDLAKDVERKNRYLWNVVSVPDPAIVVDGEERVQGSFVRIHDYVKAVAQQSVPNGMMPGWLTPEAIQRYLRFAAIPGNSGVREFALQGFEGSDPRNDWAARLSALQQHWRSTFQLPQQWVDRALNIRAYRVATIDPISGTRAPAQVWADHLLIGSRRSWIRDAYEFGDGAMSYAYQVESWKPRLDDTTKPAPATVSIVHEDLGVFRVDWEADPYRLYEVVVPGRWDGSVVPFGDIRQISDTAFAHPVCLNHSLSVLGIPRLEPTWEMSVILTLVPAAPNDDRQLFKVIVKPSDVADLLPDHAAASAARSFGPIWEARVKPGYEVARVRWLDDRAEDIEKLFGLREGTPNLDGLVINIENPTRGTFERGASLKAIARAVAARIWASLADHWEGGRTGPMYPEPLWQLKGWADRVRNEVNPAGVASGQTTLVEQLPMLDFTTYLDSSTRRLIQRMVIPM